MTETTFECFACGAKLESVDPGAPQYVTAYGGVTFGATGNYGSKVFDPPMNDDGQILIVICDECLVLRESRGFFRRFVKRPEYAVQPLVTSDLSA